MKYIVVDLEMTPLPRQFRTECGGRRAEIIEIGAVMLDDTYREVETFKTYVRPELAKEVRSDIQRLTGISTKMVRSAPRFEEAWTAFFNWCLKADDELEVIEWSDNDNRQVIREMELKHYSASDEERKFLLSWTDLQMEYGRVIGVERSTSLNNAVMLAGRDFNGRQHDALDDARNTADLLRTVRDPESRKHDLGVVIDAMTETPFGTSMGALFDFSLLKLA